MTLNWPPILTEADRIARAYSHRPTLRQLFYRLVAAGLIPNTESAYKRFSALSAEARRAGWFSPVADGTRRIEAPMTFENPADAVEWLAETQYALDRTEGQDRQLWVVVEKATLSTLTAEAVKRFGIPVVALRGYGSQTIIDTVAIRMVRDDRSVVVFYIGDFDPSGEDIPRDLRDRLGIGIDFHRVAVTPAQIEDMDLTPAPGKAADSRAAGFVARHGRLIQVEVEAIDPDTLTELIRSTVEAHVDLSTLAAVEERETENRETLRGLIDG